VTRLTFDLELAATYASPSQRARVLTEGWAQRYVYCPNCGREPLAKVANNTPASDLICAGCQETYELKSQKGSFGRKVADGAYNTMVKRLMADDNPNLLLLNYNLNIARVTNLLVVPKHFLVPELIEKRKPLPPTARRAGWIGCNILLQGIPHAGRISIIEAGGFRAKSEVLADWRRTSFIREQRRPGARGWLLHVMKCIDSLGRDTFSTADIYQFESVLKRIYPANSNVRPKLRQQLQRLRDAGYLDFLGGGTYRLRRSSAATDLS